MTKCRSAGIGYTIIISQCWALISGIKLNVLLKSQLYIHKAMHVAMSFYFKLLDEYGKCIINLRTYGPLFI